MPLRWHCSCLKCFTALLILAAQASHLVCRALVRRVTLLACLRNNSVPERAVHRSTRQSWEGVHLSTLLGPLSFHTLKSSTRC